MCVKFVKLRHISWAVRRDYNSNNDDVISEASSANSVLIFNDVVDILMSIVSRDPFEHFLWLLFIQTNTKRQENGN